MSKVDDLQAAQNLAGFFQFSHKWKTLKGVAFGLQQSVMRGQFFIRDVSKPLVDQLETGMADYLEEEPPRLEADLEPAIRLGFRMAYWVGSVQRQAGIPVSEISWINRQDSSDNTTTAFDVALPFVSVKAASIAMNWLIETVVVMAQQTHDKLPPDPESIRDATNQIHQSLKPYAEKGVNDFSILHTANQLNIPMQRLSQRGLILGTGCHSRWMFSTITDMTNPLGVKVALNKVATANLLRTSGLPGAVQSRVSSPEEAVKAAGTLGFPVVVKPADQEKGRGVNADLRDETSVVKAFKAAQEESENVLVEKFVEGFTHRLTVFEGRVIRVAKRLAGGVVGDGVHDVASLVDLWQLDEINLGRSRRLGKVLLSLDEEAIELLLQDGRRTDYIPAKDEYVRLRRRDNVNTGGTNEFLELEEVHPENLSLATDAARLLRLDFAGIDLIIKDIKRSWFEIGGVICEINAQPQLGSTNNKSVYKDVLTQLMGENFRIPAHLIICPAEETVRQQIIKDYMAQEEGTGLSDQSGIWIDGRKATQPFDSGFSAAQALLIRHEIRSAICLMTPKEIVAVGLPLNYWDNVSLVQPENLEQEEADVLGNVKVILQGHVDQLDIEL